MAFAYIEIIRPKQWYKNLLLFVGVVFAKRLGEWDLVLLAMLGFLSFCALSGAVYVFNDIIDRKRDLEHPRKCKRPIPSGRIGVAPATAYGTILVLVGLLGAYWIGWQFLVVAGLYLVLTTCYSFALKKVVILDAILLAVGFVMRALGGTVAVDVPVSPWLVISVFLLALFLAFGKRRHELSVLGEDAQNHREILKHYTPSMVDNMMNISTATLIMAYAMYTFLATNEYMMLTIPFAVYGLLRYTFLVHSAKEGGEPELIFKDLPTVVNLAMWMIAVYFILYHAPVVTSSLGGSI